MSPGSAEDVPGFYFPAKIAGVLAGFYRDIAQCFRRDLTSRENRHGGYSNGPDHLLFFI